MNSLLHYEILDNSVRQWLILAGAVVLVFLFKKYLSRLVNFILHRTLLRFSSKSQLKEFQLMVLRPMQWLIVLLIIRIALEGMNYPDAWKVKFMNRDLQDLLNKIFEAVVLFAL